MENVNFLTVTVEGEVTLSHSDLKLYVRLSPHTASKLQSFCQEEKFLFPYLVSFHSYIFYLKKGSKS